MKTLIVRYTPRRIRSVTHRLLEAFYSSLPVTKVEELDLCDHPPAFYTETSIQAYYLKNMERIPLDEKQEVALAGMDKLTGQLKRADIVVVAFPMFNFSMPGAIKTWFDSVLQVGETVQSVDGRYIGLMKGKKALILVAAGGIYSTGEGVGPYFGPGWEHAVSLARQQFQFIGYSEIESVLAEGTASLPAAQKIEKLNQAIAEVREIVKKWYY